MNKSLHFSKHFNTNNAKGIDFFDIILEKDLEAFICPFLIANNRDIKLIDRVYNQTVFFLRNLNQNYVKKNDKRNGLAFLSYLHEPNEYCLGYSDRNKGKAIAGTKSEVIFDSLRANRFAKEGISITNEAHNVLLLVEGIGQDNISDIVANVCRNLFADYTEDVCKNNNISTKKTMITYYDVESNNWEKKDAHLPEYMGKKIILVPQKIVAGKREYSSRYNWFIAKNHLSAKIMNGEITQDVSPKMVSTLNDGTRKAVIKEIYRVFRKPKDDLIKFVLEFKGSLEKFLKYAKENYPELDLYKFLGY